ncbi:MAG TPA: hypothetical protein VGR28_10930 [Candidatus Thermoplasmatota archaeon]|jgi:hypothetical protein|nr:hypothetical protein [Candidatus Thermoplasmatota archaeon]
MIKRVGLLAGVLLLAHFAAFAPSASAQTGQACTTGGLITCPTTTAVVIQPAGLIKPLGPLISLPVTVDYTFTPTAPVAFAATKITLAVESTPPWAIATLAPATYYLPVGVGGGSPQQQTTVSDTGFLLVTTTADAPAFLQGVIRVTATAEQNGALLGSSDVFEIPVQADFFSIIEATTPASIQKAKPQAEVVFPITVTNLGNAQTKIQFSIDDKPERWTANPPSDMQLASRQAGGTQNSKTTPFNIQTPYQNGYLNVVGAITLRLKSNYALDPKVIGDSTIVPTVTTTKGFYVPGPDAAMAAFALAIVGALVLRPKGKRQG